MQTLYQWYFCMEHAIRVACFVYGSLFTKLRSLESRVDAKRGFETWLRRENLNPHHKARFTFTIINVVDASVA